MLLHRKFSFAALLFFSIIISLTVCGSAGKEEVSSSTAELVWTETSQWPDNQFTQCIPPPNAGSPVRFTQGTSAGYNFFSLELTNLSLEDCRAYLQTLEDTGLSPVSELEEEPSPGSVSIANFYTNNEISLSLAYSSGAGGLILYIAKPASNI